MTMFKSKLKTVTAVLLSLALVFSCAAILVGCKDKTPNQLIIEAETAVVEGTPSGGSKVFSERINPKSDSTCSNGKYLTNLAVKNNTVSWVFSAGADAATDLYLSVANGKSKAGEFTAGGGKVFNLSVNGTEVNVPETTVAAASTYCDVFQTIKIEGVAVKKGFNTVVMKINDETNQINVDYLGVDSDKASVELHEHDWETETVRPTCEEGGTIHRLCKSCKIKFLFDTTPATGHAYGNYHFDSELGKMVRVCANDNSHIFVGDAPNSKFYGEVFEERDEFATRPHEIIFEAELAHVGSTVTEDGAPQLNNGNSYVENIEGASGGKIVANISKVGNFVEFTVNAAEACEVDLVFIMSNVRWTEDGIGILEPLSDYMTFTVNEENVDFSFVSFPGDSEYNYYNWRYVVMKNIELDAGPNSLVYSPIPQAPEKEDGDEWVTVPNLDALYIYSDKSGIITIERSYDINDAVIDNAFVSEFANENAMVKTENKSEFLLKAGQANTGDVVITIESADNLDDLRTALSLSINGKDVNLEDMAVAAGNGNKLIIKNLPINLGINSVTYRAEAVVAVTDVKVYTETPLKAMLNAVLDAENYDYMTNKDVEGTAVPKLTFEAEDAILSKTNDTIKEAGSASGGKDVENFSGANNKITWNVNFSAGAAADIAIRMACANWDGSGNSNMEDLSKFFIITVDGVAADLSALTLTCSGGGEWYDWNVVVIKGLNLDAGDHVIEMICTGGAFPNTDTLYVYSADDVTVTAVTPPAPEVDPETPAPAKEY